ncbi:hypothetical protein C8F01DRAFT_1339336 [Mycena amicta]|nr:hypothetical protein C8F01DRAFT_1339336 [Mycena amicta]
MSVVSQCPNELWLEILQHIPRRQLSSISAANRLLRQLTLPLLFACLQVRLRIPKPDKGDGYQWEPILDPLASIERMQFWMSPAIAPLVRSCTAGARSGQYINCPTQVDFFMNNLYTLTRLRSLSLWEISIGRERFATLHQLPCLEELSVNCCALDVYLPCDDDEEPCQENIRVPILRLSKLSILTSTIAQSPRFHPDWMLVVDAARLRDLTLGSLSLQIIAREWLGAPDQSCSCLAHYHAKLGSFHPVPTCLSLAIMHIHGHATRCRRADGNDTILRNSC